DARVGELGCLVKEKVAVEPAKLPETIVDGCSGPHLQCDEQNANRVLEQRGVVAVSPVLRNLVALDARRKEARPAAHQTNVVDAAPLAPCFDAALAHLDEMSDPVFTVALRP